MTDREELLEISEFRKLSLLLVNKAINKEASEVFYEINMFSFSHSSCVEYFYEQTLARGGENYLNRVTKIIFEIDFWTHNKDYTIDGLGLREMFSYGEYNFRNLFPCLKRLIVDFADSHTFVRRGRHCSPTYADEEGWHSDMFRDLWDVMWWHPFENVEVTVLGLREPENEWHMERDLMGLEYEEFVEKPRIQLDY